MLEVPQVVRNKALAAGADRWLDDLPSIVADLEGLWGISVGRGFPHATEAFVAEATTSEGGQAVLKVHIDRPGNHVSHEIRVLRTVAGDGCAELLQHDEARGARLLERLGRPLVELGLDIETRHAVLCDTAARVWRHEPDKSLQSGADKARWLARFVEHEWEGLGRPCSEAAVDHALACAHRRAAAHDDERAVLVHGDVHQWNALQSKTGFKLVDPDGLRAEPEYDLGIIMREDPEALLEGDPRDRAHWLAGRTGLDPTAIWEWGCIERVSTGLLGTRVGLQPVAREMLATAERIAQDFS
jgi:streptomycin 6-kinase